MAPDSKKRKRPNILVTGKKHWGFGKGENLHNGWDVQLHCHIIINEDLVTPLLPLLSNHVCTCVYIYIP